MGVKRPVAEGVNMKRGFSVVMVVVSLLGVSALAQGTGPSAPASGYRAEFLRGLADTEKKFVNLAEKMPQEKYTWRPGEGVRSISEVYLHVAVANYGIPRVLGTQPPEGFNPKGFEASTTEKAKVVEALKQSFAHMRQAALNVSDADADKPVKMFGGETTYRGALLIITRHTAEHLGQSIAYARINGVVPPWTEEAQQRQQQQPQKKSP